MHGLLKQVQADATAVDAAGSLLRGPAEFALAALGKACSWRTVTSASHCFVRHHSQHHEASQALRP